MPLTLTYREATNLSKARRVSDPQGKNRVFQAAGILSYVFEVLFQVACLLRITESVTALLLDNSGMRLTALVSNV